jgi:hypothetical protein
MAEGRHLQQEIICKIDNFRWLGKIRFSRELYK